MRTCPPSTSPHRRGNGKQSLDCSTRATLAQRVGTELRGCSGCSGVSRRPAVQVHCKASRDALQLQQFAGCPMGASRRRWPQFAMHWWHRCTLTLSLSLSRSPIPNQYLASAPGKAERARGKAQRARGKVERARGKAERGVARRKEQLQARDKPSRRFSDLRKELRNETAFRSLAVGIDIGR